MQCTCSTRAVHCMQGTCRAHGHVMVHRCTRARCEHLVPHWREQRGEGRARQDAGDEGDGPRCHRAGKLAAAPCFARRGSSCAVWRWWGGIRDHKLQRAERRLSTAVCSADRADSSARDGGCWGDFRATADFGVGYHTRALMTQKRLTAKRALLSSGATPRGGCRG